MNGQTGVEEKHIFSPGLLNVFRFGFNRAFTLTDTAPTIDLDPALQFVPGVGFGEVRVAASLAGSRPAVTPVGGGDLLFLAANVFQYSDQIFYTRGKHSFQWGVQVHRIQRNEDGTDRKRGTMLFLNLDDLLAANASRFSGAAPPGTRGQIVGVELDPNPVKGYRQTYFAVYGQDEMRLWPNFTLNLGLRYEFITVPTEVNGRISNFVLERITPEARFMRTTPVLGQPWFENNSVRGFAPRLGIAWDPFSTGKTSIRAGIGVFYEQLESEYRFFNQVNPPSFCGRISCVLIFRARSPALSILHGLHPMSAASTLRSMSRLFCTTTWVSSEN